MKEFLKRLNHLFCQHVWEFHEEISVDEVFVGKKCIFCGKIKGIRESIRNN